jgi:hypothetical protein
VVEAAVEGEAAEEGEGGGVEAGAGAVEVGEGEVRFGRGEAVGPAGRTCGL